jgi:hypothetical protein
VRLLVLGGGVFVGRAVVEAALQDVAGRHGYVSSRAVASGLRCRPVEETLRDTWAALTTA